MCQQIEFEEYHTHTHTIGIDFNVNRYSLWNIIQCQPKSYCAWMTRGKSSSYHKYPISISKQHNIIIHITTLHGSGGTWKRLSCSHNDSPQKYLQWSWLICVLMITVGYYGYGYWIDIKTTLPGRPPSFLCYSIRTGFMFRSSFCCSNQHEWEKLAESKS